MKNPNEIKNPNYREAFEWLFKPKEDSKEEYIHILFSTVAGNLAKLLNVMKSSKEIEGHDFIALKNFFENSFPKSITTGIYLNKITVRKSDLSNLNKIWKKYLTNRT